jgi:hypothetical protein
MIERVFIEWHIYAGDPSGNNTFAVFRGLFKKYPFPSAFAWSTGTFYVFLSEKDAAQYPEIEAFVEQKKRQKAESGNELLAWKYEKSRSQVLDIVEWLFSQEESPPFVCPVYTWSMGKREVYRYLEAL